MPAISIHDALLDRSRANQFYGREVQTIPSADHVNPVFSANPETLMWFRGLFNFRRSCKIKALWNEYTTDQPKCNALFFTILERVPRGIQAWRNEGLMGVCSCAKAGSASMCMKYRSLT